MTLAPANAPVAGNAPGAEDLGPLAWVLGEIQKTLEASSKSLRRFARESANTPDIDAGPLRLVRQQLHQAVGALQMVGHPTPALVIGAMEFAVQSFVQEPVRCDEAAVQKMDRAGFAVGDFLHALLAGKTVSSVAMFPQYREVLELVGNERVHPADLWALQWRWADISLTSAKPALIYDPAVRSKFDREVLKVVKTGDDVASRRLQEICVGLSRGSGSARARSFWALAGAFFEALGLSLITPDVYVKRAASRVLLQYATLARGDETVSDRLGQDLLFFCAQAAPSPRDEAITLRAVRAAWGIADERAVDYTSEQFGRFDPVVLAQARKRIEAAKEMWSALSGGDVARVRQAADTFAQLTESLQKLHPPSLPMAQALNNAVDASMRSGKPPSTELAMEVATSVLYLEAAFEDLDPRDRQLTARTVQLAGRIERAREGGRSEPLEPWMEELYRRVSDRQTMGTVVDELRSHLSELEKSMDQFFRRPTEKSLLRTVPSQLMQMRGVFSVLGLDQASQTVQRMRDNVEELMGRAESVDETGAFDSLGNNLGALGFLIDMLGYQPALAKRLFVFDAAAGELKPLMGRQAESAAAQAQAETASFAQPSQPAALSGTVLTPEQIDAQIAAKLAALASPSKKAASPIEEFSRATDSWTAKITGPAPLEALPETFVTELEEDDLQNIFLDEAREVVQNGLVAVEELEHDPTDVGELTILRRAFHTLKGSSRMVGLSDIGDAAWSLEQLLNTWLADQRSATPELLNGCSTALRDFGAWVEAIASGEPHSWQAAPFRDLADSMRTGEPTVAKAPHHVNAESLAVAARQIAAEAPPAPLVPSLPDLPALDLAPAMETVKPAEAPRVAMEPVAEAEAEADAAIDEFHSNDFPSTDFLDFDEPAKPVTAAPVAPVQPVAPVVADPKAWTEIEVEGVPPAEPSRDFMGADIDFLSTASAPLEPAFEPTALSDPYDFRTDSAPHDTPTYDHAAAQPASDEALPPLEFEATFALEAETALKQENEFAAFDAAMLEAQNAAPVAIAHAHQAAWVAAHSLTSGEEAPAEPAPVEADAVAAAEPELVDAQAPAEPEAVAEASVQAPQAEEEPVVAEATEAVAQADEEVAAQVAEEQPSAQALEAADEAQAADALQSFEALQSAEALQAAEALQSTEAPQAATPAEPTAAQEPEAPAPVAIDDSVKAIGPLRIGIALYNVYLNEADEWSRQLAHEVGEWALEPHVRVADSTIAMAHSLAGSSATVGFQSLSGMARLFEAALTHLQMQGRGTHEQGTILVLAADELRRLLHQFAAGVLKDPAGETLEALREVAASPMPVESMEVRVQPAPAPVLHMPADVVLEDSDDAIDMADAVDADLFPIFEEEAAELLPRLAAALRAWVETPGDLSQRAVTLRALHTLKGSARLAGAMRLGERAHRMESDIEAIGTESIERRAIEQVVGRFDALQASFDGLREADNATQAELAQRAAAVTAAVPSVPSVVVAPIAPVVPLDVPEVPAAQAPAAEAVQAAPVARSDEAKPAVADAAAADNTPAAKLARIALPTPSMLTPSRAAASQVVRIRTHLLDRLVMQAGEVIITRSRLEGEIAQLRSSLTDLTGNLDRLRQQLRDIEVQAESQMQSRLAQAKDSQQGFDPLEFDRFTRVQELTRMMAESVNDVATVQRTLQKTVQATEDDLSAQARQTRELQRGLLRTRMVEFEGISDRLYRVVRQASKDTGKQVRLDITGGSIEMDRGVLDRMTPAFEHLLRNCVAHGIEDASVRTQAGKEASGLIVIDLHHEGNDVSVTFRDDGAGLDQARIAERAYALGLVPSGQAISPQQCAELIFQPGFSTATQVSELAGRGIGMDVVRADVAALGGRIETQSTAGQGTSFKLVLPLTTAVTHVVMMRSGDRSIGVPSNLVELVQRAGATDLEAAYASERYPFGGEEVPFFWAGALLQSSARSERALGKANTVVVVRSAAQRVALHVDEVLGNQEVVVKNLGPQLSRLPGMAGISVLASGAVALIYNPVALAAVHGDEARHMQSVAAANAAANIASADGTATTQGSAESVPPVVAAARAPQIPLVLVVDDSITVRRVTQRLLQREGYRVSLAADGLQALERLQQERPALVLSDIEMPRMDGFDLARNIRADEALADLPIIMITSRIAEKHRDHAKQLGVNHYLGKPYSEEELLRLVRSYTSEVVPLEA
ncbi:Hpt domain-containing protein [Variovorax sp. J22R133]|uniref:Hpt domain-containing protein n=1 Tax=Variovorax brevis TaxID=3053503 RepID=UPI002574DC50|nr:Hpt domain-containing protein [Variovorax sp. J22R133]MDM0114951.1 Hpt domain-containing protein [Variovorax sp. J22R133]